MQESNTLNLFLLRSRRLFFLVVTTSLFAGLVNRSGAQSSTFDLTGGLPAFRAGHAVTTSVPDILPAVTDLEGLEQAAPLPFPTDWKFSPGYYRSTVRSYCMDLGRHAPNRGDSVCIAPILGDRAPLIHNILARSQQNSYVMQSDIQDLIWAVADGTPLGWYNSRLLDRVSPLLTQSELAIINMPHSAQPDANQMAAMQEMAVMNFERQRSAAFNGFNGRGDADPRLTAAYGQLRQVGITTSDQFNLVEQRINERFMEAAQSANVPQGLWSNIGNGFYLRAFVNTYSSTVLEVLKVAPGKVIRDDMNRISRFESDGYSIDVEYEDSPATKSINDKPETVWNFKSIVYRAPGDRTLTIENRGYIIVESDDTAKSAGRLARNLTRDPFSVGTFHDALWAATSTTPLKRTDNWIVGNLNRLLALRNLPIIGSALAASSMAANLDVSNFAATSTNNNKQRLALSNVVVQ